MGWQGSAGFRCLATGGLPFPPSLNPPVHSTLFTPAAPPRVLQPASTPTPLRVAICPMKRVASANQDLYITLESALNKAAVVALQTNMDILTKVLPYLRRDAKACVSAKELTSTHASKLSARESAL